MNDKVGLPDLFDRLNTLTSDLDSVYRTSTDEWPHWHRDLEDFKKKLAAMMETNHGWNQQLHNTLNNAAPAASGSMGDAQASPGGNGPMTKEDQLKLKSAMKEIDQLFDVTQRITREAFMGGHIGQEDVRAILNDVISRVLATLPENNEYKQKLKHLQTRLASGDEIQSLLDSAQKIKPTKSVGTKEAQPITIDTSDLGNAIKGLALGALAAGGVAAAPKVMEKVGQSDVMAGLMTGLQSALENMTGQTEQVEVEEEEEVYEETILEVEEKEEVRIDV